MTSPLKRKSSSHDNIPTPSAPVTKKHKVAKSPTKKPSSPGKGTRSKARPRKSKLPYKVYLVRDIVAENAQGLLQVAWEDYDDSWNTWEPRHFIGKDWLDYWDSKKVQQDSNNPKDGKVKTSKAQNRSTTSQAASPRSDAGQADSRKARRSIVINSSAESSQERENEQIQTSTPRVTSTQDQPQVRLSKPLGFSPSAYEEVYFSPSQKSHAASSSSLLEPPSQQSEPLQPTLRLTFTNRSPRTTSAPKKVIPDSQSVGQLEVTTQYDSVPSVSNLSSKSQVKANFAQSSQDSSLFTPWSSARNQFEEQTQTESQQSLSSSSSSSYKSVDSDPIEDPLSPEITRGALTFTQGPNSHSSTSSPPPTENPAKSQSTQTDTSREIDLLLPSSPTAPVLNQAARDIETGVRGGVLAESHSSSHINSNWHSGRPSTPSLLESSNFQSPPRPSTVSQTLSSSAAMSSTEASGENDLGQAGLAQSQRLQDQVEISSMAGEPNLVDGSNASPTSAHSGLDNIQAAQTYTPLPIDSPDASISEQGRNLAKSEASASASDSTTNVFPVPLTHSDLGLKQYNSYFSQNRRNIENFIADPSWEESSEMVNAMNELLDTFNAISTHVDLINAEVLTQENITDEQRYLWAIQASSKFRFLKFFCDSYQDNGDGGQTLKRVAIFGKPGETLQLLESFLKGADISYERPDASARSISTSTNLFFTILPTGSTTRYHVHSPDVIIALDGTFNVNHPFVIELRKHIQNVDQLCPVIELVITYSVEHIQRTLPDIPDNVERLRTLIEKAAEQRKFMKRMTDAPFKPDKAGQIVGEYLSGVTKSLDLPVLNAIHIPPPSVAQEYELSNSNGSGTPKRPRDPNDSEDYGVQSSKKLRTSAVPSFAPSSIEVTRISDSVKGASPRSQAVFRQQLEQSAVQIELRAEIERFKSANKDLQASLDDHIKSLELIRSTYEHHAHENRVLRAQMPAAEQAKAKAEARSETLAKENQELKKEAARLRTELKESIAQLEGSSTPSVAELGKLKAEANDKEMAERRLANRTSELEYIRDEYQKARGLASEYASEIEDLKSQVAKLEKKASGEATKLREMFEQNRINRATDSVQQMSRELVETKKLAQRQGEELKALREKEAAKMTTRAVSMGPLGRAPLGSGGSLAAHRRPGTGSRNPSRVPSRQASPIPLGPSSQPAGLGSKIAAQHALGRSGR